MGAELYRLCNQIALDFAKKEKSEKEELFVAETDGTLIGCVILCETDDANVGQLRLFAVEKSTGGMVWNRFNQCFDGKGKGCWLKTRPFGQPAHWLLRYITMRK